MVEKIQELEQPDLDSNLVRAYVEWLAARGHGPLLASAAHAWLVTALGQPAPEEAAAKKRKKSKKMTAISMADLSLELDGSCGPQGLRALAHLMVRHTCACGAVVLTAPGLALLHFFFGRHFIIIIIFFSFLSFFSFMFEYILPHPPPPSRSRWQPARK